MQSSKATQIRLDLTSDLQKWRAFLAIAELGSLTRAALFLDSNQSLLSRHLNALERECNARLFNRTGRGVTLSDVGQRIFPHGQGAAGRCRAARAGDPRRGARAGRARDHRLAALDHQPDRRPAVQAAARAASFGVQLKILEGSSGQVEEWLADARVDIAILYRYGNAQPEQEQALATVDSYLIGAARRPPDFAAARSAPSAALHELPFILPGAPNGLRTALDAHRAAGAHHAWRRPSRPIRCR